MIDLRLGDCLEVMKTIESGSIDAIITDPPYGTTACKWDSVIPFEPMWEQLKRVIKPKGAVVLFGQEPFSSYLRISNVKEFKYDFYWRKTRPSGFVNSKLKPLKDIEIISVFSFGTTANRSDRNMPYNPQGLIEVNKDWSRPKRYGSGKGVNTTRESNLLKRKIKFEGYPRQILEYKNHNGGNVHPTQKPVLLMEYLIKTYTNEGETVLDFTMGSGTTMIACNNLNRNGIGIEKDETYFNIAQDRIEKNKREKLEEFNFNKATT